MAYNNPEDPEDHFYCGNCGTPVGEESDTCGNCGSLLLRDDGLDLPPDTTAPVDYVHYCRACGVPVPWRDSQGCPRCGTAPLCPEHLPQGARGCVHCAPGLASVPEKPATFTTATPDGPWAQSGRSIPCGGCGARIREGVRHCPQCGVEQHGLAASGEVEYMGFWVRLAAAIVDGVITLVLALLLVAASGLPWIGSVANVLYYVAFTATQGQTPGKMLLGIQVVDANGRTPPLTKVLLREVVLRALIMVSIILNDVVHPAFLAVAFAGTFGYLWVAWDPRKRGWHDYIGGTFAVRKSTGQTA